MNKHVMGWMCVVALLAAPAVATAGVAYNFTTADYDFGSGTGAGYTAGADFTMVRGYAIQDTPADRLKLGNVAGATRVGPGGAQTLALENTLGLAGGTYKAIIGGGTIRDASLVFGYTDDNNYYRVGFKDNNVYGFGGCAQFIKRVGGVTTRLSPTANGAGPAMDDIATVTVNWDPGTGQIDVDVVRTIPAGTVLVLDTTALPSWNFTDTSHSGGQVGLWQATSYANAGTYMALELPDPPAAAKPIPEPAALALFGLGGIVALARRRRS